MKLDQKFVMREVMGEWIIVPVGRGASKMNGMITANETGAFLWKLLQKGTTEEAMTDALFEEYEVTREQALADVRAFVAYLEQNGVLHR